MIRDNTNSVSTSTENITVVTVVTKGPQGAPGPIGPQGPSGSDGDSDWYAGDGFITSSNDVQITGSLNVLAPALTTSSISLSESIFRIQSINPSALSGDGAYLDISTAGDSDRIDVVLNGPQPKLILNKSGSGAGSQFIFQRDGSTTSFMQVNGSDVVQVAGYYDFRTISVAATPPTTLRLYNNANFILQAPTTASGVISSSNYISASEFIAPQGTINQLTASHAITASYALNAGGGNSDTFPYTGSAIISGSLTVTGSTDISGSLTASSLTTPQGIINQLTSSYAVTSSYAITASHALNAGGGSGFPFVGDAVITGSLTVSSSNNTSSLTLYGSGSNPVFIVQGSAGELFSISDSLSGSLFSVHNEFGLPILETFSDDRTLIGTYTARSLYTTAVIVSSDSSITQSLYSINTGSDYDGAFFEYTAKSASNARAGTITAVWSESVVQYTETTTADIGSTSGVELLVEQSQSSYHLHLNTPTNGWKVKTIIRSI